MIASLTKCCGIKTYHDHPRSDIARERMKPTDDPKVRHVTNGSTVAARLAYSLGIKKRKRGDRASNSPAVHHDKHIFEHDLEHSPGTFSHTAPEHPLGKRGPDE